MAYETRGFQFARKANRRQSTPVTPESPTVQWRPRNNELRDNIGHASQESPFDSPTIDITLPSPDFDFSPSSSLGFDSRRSPAGRMSEDASKDSPRVQYNDTRPPTGGLTQPKNVYSPSQGATRRPNHTFEDEPIDRDLRSSFSKNAQNDNKHGIRGNTIYSQMDRSPQDILNGTSSSNKKSKFNLLNPMSLLARRRSSNQPKNEDTSVPLRTVHVPAIPDDFDPSIRGKIVHDFSTPRTRRIPSYNSPQLDLSSPSYPPKPYDASSSPAVPSPLGVLHARQPSITAQDLDVDYRPQQAPENAQPHQPVVSLDTSRPPQSVGQTSANRFELATAHTVQREIPVEPVTQSAISDVKDYALTTSNQLPSLDSAATPSTPVRSGRDSASRRSLPKHMASTSSRFSYLGQPGSIAQEKALEDRHKEHEARNPRPTRQSVASIDEDNGYDELDEYDEEEIPSTNADLYRTDTSDELDIPIKDINVATNRMRLHHEYSFEEGGSDLDTDAIEIKDINVPTSQARPEANDLEHLTPDASELTDDQLDGLQEPRISSDQTMLKDPGSSHVQSQFATPNVEENAPVHGASYKYPSNWPTGQSGFGQPSELSYGNLYLGGLGISTDFQNSGSDIDDLVVQDDNTFDDAELYFDDGEFGDHEISAADDAVFDEDQLDDTSKIRDIPSENEKRYQDALKAGLPNGDTRISFVEGDELRFNKLSSQPSLRDGPLGASTSINDGLTEGNLAAYHDALVQAATKAANDGRFARTVSFSGVSEDEEVSPIQNSTNFASSRESRYSQVGLSGVVTDDDKNGYDEDDVDEDALIAAANAEALESDDDGFYGSEFGFYARAYGKDNLEIAGGYFASRGSNGIKRSHSGKNNFQEPSLTPITERSEWSTRNSVASLPVQGVFSFPGSAQSMQSPGLAQLMSDPPLGEESINLQDLIRARRAVFGGSSTSLNSLPNDRIAHSQSSPLAHLSTNNLGTGISIHSSPLPMSSTSLPPQIPESDYEDESEDDFIDDRPTLTQNTPMKVPPPRLTDHTPSKFGFRDEEPKSPSVKRHHSRNSSGSESVSYMQDRDGKWMLERRRTDESGTEEVEKEYVGGGWI